MELAQSRLGLGVSAAIAEVIAHGQLRPVYQPIVDAATRAASLGFEGLIRPVPPAPFADPAALFAAAEASGQAHRPRPGLHRDDRGGRRQRCRTTPS